MHKKKSQPCPIGVHVKRIQQEGDPWKSSAYVLTERGCDFVGYDESRAIDVDSALIVEVEKKFAGPLE